MFGVWYLSPSPSIYILYNFSSYKTNNSCKPVRTAFIIMIINKLDPLQDRVRPVRTCKVLFPVELLYISGIMAAPPGNKYALGNSGGRPAHYETPGELAIECQGYFDWCLENGEKATVTGLTLYLGFCSRSSLDAYEDKGEEFKYIIKRAKLGVENSYELSGQTFDIFALKNMGWKDKTEQDLNIAGEPIRIIMPPNEP